MNATSPSNPNLPNFINDFEQNALRFAFKISATGHTLKEAVLKAVDLVYASFPAPADAPATGPAPAVGPAPAAGPAPATGPAPAADDARDSAPEIQTEQESDDKKDAPVEFSAAETEFFDNYQPPNDFLTETELREIAGPGYKPPVARRKPRPRPKPARGRGRKTTPSRWWIFKWLTSLWSV